MAAKHFMIYYQRGTGTYIVTEPRPWSREHQELFPQFNFVDNHPTTEFIEDWLINNREFQKVVNEEDINVILNLNPHINL